MTCKWNLCLAAKQGSGNAWGKGIRVPQLTLLLCPEKQNPGTLESGILGAPALLPWGFGQVTSLKIMMRRAQPIGQHVAACLMESPEKLKPENPLWGL